MGDFEAEAAGRAKEAGAIMTNNERDERDQMAFDEMVRGWEAADAQRDQDEADGAVMFLTFEQAAFMEQVCQWDGLIVPLTALHAIRMAFDLEAGGLVTLQRGHPDHVIVSAVRPSGE